MTRWLPHPILVVTMILVWALLLDSFAFGVLLLGAVLSILIAAWTSAFWPDRPRPRRPMAVLRFVAVVLWDIIIANLAVARLVLSPQNRLNPRFLEIPLDIKDPYAIVTLTSVITLTPGTVSSELSADRRTLYVHALDATDPAAAVRQIKQRYEAPLKEIFE
jgi:multicomponent K+:H+ antiporter subunit E